MTERKEKEAKVSNWLEKVYGKGYVPQFQRSDETLDYLAKLMELTEEEERGLDLIADLQQHQTGEFNEEIKHLRETFKNLGLNGVKNSEFEMIVEILASSADMLNVDDPNESVLDSAISETRLKAVTLPAENFLKQAQFDKDKRSLIDELKMLNKTEQALTNAKTEALIDEESVAQLRKKYAFMQEKHKEYSKTYEKFATTLRKHGYHKSTSHEAILELKKKLDTIEERTKPIVSKLEGYKGLPPSFELAQAKLAEKEQVLHDLKDSWAREVEKIKF